MMAILQSCFTAVERKMNFIRLLLAFLLPPASVYIQFGVGSTFWINCGLTLFGFVPGVVHAVYVMASRPPGLARLN